MFIFNLFCGLLWTIHLRNENVMRLGFWRTLQSSLVLNTVFTTSVLVVIFLHSLRVSKSASARPDLQNKTHSRHQHSTEAYINQKPQNFWIFRFFKKFRKKNFQKFSKDFQEILNSKRKNIFDVGRGIQIL